MAKKKPIKVYFDGQDGERPFEALEITGYWNGWAIPRMTAAEAERCAAYVARGACGDVDDGGGEVTEEIRACVRDESRPDGSVVLNLGLTFNVAEEEPGTDPCDFSIPGLVLS